MIHTLSTSSRLIWKEWRELRWFLIIPLALFIALSLIEAVANMSNTYQPGFRTDLPAGLNGGFGAMLAIFIAVAATTRDLRDELKVFWQSRPISATASVLVKFVTGLLVLLSVCVPPLVLQIELARRLANEMGTLEEALVTLLCHTPLLVLIYGVAFALGCLIRQATHAAMVSVGAAMALYFLPTLVPALANFSALHLMNDNAIQLASNGKGWTLQTWWLGSITVKHEYAAFGAVMLGGSAAMLPLAMWIVRRDVRICTDYRFVVWSLGIVILLTFSTLAFAVGSNVPVRRSTELPMRDQSVAAMAGEDGRGVILMRDGNRVTRKWTRTVPVRLSSFNRTESGIEFGPVIQLPDEINLPNAHTSGNIIFCRPEYPDRAYVLVERSRYIKTPRQVTARVSDHYEIEATELHTVDLSGKRKNPVIHRLDLLPLLPIGDRVRAHRIGATIYVAGVDRFAFIDLSNPDAPVATVPEDLIDTAKSRGPTFDVFWTIASYRASGGTETVDMSLPPIPELSPRQRLDLKLALMSPYTGYAGDGGEFLAINDKRISTYRMKSIDSTTATFQLIGRRAYTPLERLTGRSTWKLMMHEGRLFAVEDAINKSIAVYDFDATTPPVLTGHFAVPREMDFLLMPLADEQLLVGADRLYELKLPGKSR